MLWADEGRSPLGPVVRDSVVDDEVEGHAGRRGDAGQV